MGHFPLLRQAHTPWCDDSFSDQLNVNATVRLPLKYILISLWGKDTGRR